MSFAQFFTRNASMAKPRKSRTPTTSSEQAILSSYIRQFFEVPDRSDHRGQIVSEVLSILNTSDRQWTARAVRLWFKNNRNHYFEHESRMPIFVPGGPPPYGFPPPVGFAFGYVPMHIEPRPCEMYWMAPFPPPMALNPRQASGTEAQAVAGSVGEVPIGDYRRGIGAIGSLK